MTLTYLDTSALMDWLEAKAAKPEAKANSCGPQVAAMLQDPLRTCALSELTIIEVLNATHAAWRSSQPSKASYNEAWAREAQAALLGLVEGGQLLVRPSQPSDLQHALMLVTVMTEAGRNFRAWDAVHTRIAVQWAREAEEAVELVTTNGDFKAFLAHHPYFSRHLSLMYITA